MFVDLLSLIQFHSWKHFLAPKLYQVFELLTTQGIATAAKLVYGFLCVRLLTVPEYAKFAVVFGFLGTLSVLMDIAFTGTLLPLVGERIDDRQVIADYVASLRQLAHLVYLAVAPAAVIAYPILVRGQHWNWRIVSAMVVVLLVASWCGRVSGAYGAVLIVRRDRSIWYRIQVIASVCSLILLGAVWALDLLNAFSAILISTAAMGYIALSYYFRARRLLGLAGNPSREKRNEIVQLALPGMPNAIFYAFQGQISLLLITLFGHVSAVASVGALSRLAQVFVLFGQIGPLLLEPYFARLTNQMVKRSYFGVLAIEGLFCSLIVWFAWQFPQIFLWILGHNYSGLRLEAFLMIAGSAIGYLASLLWTIHCARRFIYWWNGLMTIVFTVAIQIWFIWKVDLSTVRAVLILNLVTAIGCLLVNMLTGAYGFVRGPRDLTRQSMETEWNADI